jgi:hypothetical protein
MLRTAGRTLLGLLAAAQAEIAIWGLITPHGFFTGFPGFGRHWVSPMGPYDQHLVRDYAALELGFAVLLVCAAIWFERRLVLASGAAFIAGTLPHFAYHLTTTAMLSTADNVLSLGSFVIELGLAAAAMALVVQAPQAQKGSPDGAFATS